MTQRLEKSIRWKYIYRLKPEDGSYNPKIYINGDKEPEEASDEIDPVF